MIPLIDQDEGIRLSGDSPALYMRMLSRFLQDPSMDRLKGAVSRQDRQEAYLHAHTLKGLSAQLALPALNREAATLCSLLRSDACAMNTLPETMLAAYDQTIEAIMILTHGS